MAKRHIRLFVGQNGMLSVEDPSPLEVTVLKRLGIELGKNRRYKNADVITPNYIRLRGSKLPYPLPKKQAELKALHNEMIEKALSNANASAEYSLSIFDLKRKILKMHLKNCCLCGYRCNGERTIKGECPIGQPSYYHQHFVHVGEEEEIGRTLVLEMTGCNIRCRFCQKGELIKPDNISVRPFTNGLWKEIEKEYDCREFNNISFLGGNPDQSILTVLDFLENAPDWASHLPIVWHTNGYSRAELYSLLWGLVDIWAFDFKYFSDNCAVSLSNAPDYVDTAKRGLKFLITINNSTPVIVRHLILPGHWDCCQKPLIAWLTKFKSDIIFHPMFQYKPMWKITVKNGELSRVLKNTEVTQVINYALNTGLVLTQFNYYEG